MEYKVTFTFYQASLRNTCFEMLKLHFEIYQKDAVTCSS